MRDATGLAALEHRLDPADTLASVFVDLGPTLKADLGSIAIAVSDAEFEVLAHVGPEGKQEDSRHRFSAADTAGAWVTAYGVPFVANEVADVTRFGRTHDFMLAEQFQAFCTLPIELGQFPRHRTGLFYMFSRQRNAFSGHAFSIVLRMREVIEPVMRAHLSVNELQHGSAFPEPPAPTAKRPSATLEEIERAHIIQTLDRLNWIIEGPRGAAATLGLNPSTLRNRMRKLSIARQAESAEPAST
ncbi:MAG: helix-turn-helix domain-containing protein [Planctomycetota bacterium]